MEKKKRTKVVNEIINSNKQSEKEFRETVFLKKEVINTDKEAKKNLKFGDKLAIWITKRVGSWGFILGFSLFLILWIILNLFILKLDPYPFILLNLLLSCLAALQAPIIMISDNRAFKNESMRSINDYHTDLKSELLLEELHAKMDKILKNQEIILKNKESKKEKK